MYLRRLRWQLCRALLPVLLALVAALVPAVASAHPGGMAADGCHNQRASGTCHCHRTGASRPGCTSDGEEGDGAGDRVQPDGGTATGRAATPARDADPAPAGNPPAPAEWIRIATWNLNLLHWRTGGALWRGAAARSDEDYRTLARYARVLNADVIALQEVNGPRAAARVFPPRDYELHFSGRHDSRYNDIYNGFAVRKGKFDQVAKRDHEALGLDTPAPATSSVGASSSRYRRTDGDFACSTSTSSRSAFSKSLRSPRSRPCRTLARQIGTP